MPMLCEHCGRPTKTVVLQEKDDGDKGQMWCVPCHDAKKFAGVNLDHTAIQGDEIPGGMVVENYGPKAIVFYTKSAMAEYRKRHGLIVKESFCPFPGTDSDPAGVMNPEGYVDAYTMNARKELLLRAMKCPEDISGVIRPRETFASDDAAEVRKYVS